MSQLEALLASLFQQPAVTAQQAPPLVRGPVPAQPGASAPQSPLGGILAALTGGQGTDTLAGRSGMGGSMPRPRAAPLPAARPPVNEPGYNDHSTRDNWLALLGSVSPAFSGFAGHMIGKDQQRNAQHVADAARQRQQQALLGSMKNGQFDPQAYLKSQAELDLGVPSIEDIGRLDEMGGKRSDREQKQLDAHRAIIGSVIAPFAGIPAESRDAYREHARDVLIRNGIPEDEADYALSDLSDEHINTLLSAGIGGDKYLDNQRGEAGQEETRRHNTVTERQGDAHIGLARNADARAAAAAKRAVTGGAGIKGVPAGFVLDGN